MLKISETLVAVCFESI